MAYNNLKTDPELGQRVHEYLVKMGVETPTIDNHMSRTDKIDIIESKFAGIMNTLGLDLSDDSLADTPRRVAKMYVNEIFWGLDYEAFPKCTTVDNKMKYDEMVSSKETKPCVNKLLLNTSAKNDQIAAEIFVKASEHISKTKPGLAKNSKEFNDEVAKEADRLMEQFMC
jgi:transcriptional regulator of met regulon